MPIILAFLFFHHLEENRSSQGGSRAGAGLHAGDEACDEVVLRVWLCGSSRATGREVSGAECCERQAREGEQDTEREGTRIGHCERGGYMDDAGVTNK